MDRHSTVAEVGSSILQGYMRMQERLERDQQHLQELQEEMPAYGNEREYVMESRRHDPMERHVIHRLVTEEGVESLQKGVEEYQEKIRQALDKLPDSSAALLRKHYFQNIPWTQCAQEMDSSIQSQAFLRRRIRAYEEFWNMYQRGAGQNGTMIKAKECRMWRDYVQWKKAEGEMEPEEAKKFLAEKTGVSARRMHRLLRFLALIPEFQYKLDAGEIGEAAAYQVSFLKANYQHQLTELLDYRHLTINEYQAKALRKLTFHEWFRQEEVLKILLP